MRSRATGPGSGPGGCAASCAGSGTICTRAGGRTASRGRERSGRSWLNSPGRDITTASTGVTCARLSPSSGPRPCSPSPAGDPTSKAAAAVIAAWPGGAARRRARSVGSTRQDGGMAPASAAPLTGFSDATMAWFTAAFAEPTPAQSQAWRAIGNGEHTLVVAPTGSGKTLAAFLWAIDKLASEPVPANQKHRCRVLYISPMKALAVDVERNLRSPLTGVRHAARRLGLPEPDITVAVRTGGTAADERRKMASKPPDILITTPESLFLLLTSQAREGLRGVETVIIDEVHAMAGGKRGAHLALSLERLDALRAEAGPAQRIGLSATVWPPAEVAAFLGGALP